MNNERRKILRSVLDSLQPFVDGKIAEADAVKQLEQPLEDLEECMFIEQECRDKLLEISIRSPKVERADTTVYDLEDAYEEMKMTIRHLKDDDAEYQGLIDVYIKSIMQHVKNAIER